MNNKILLKSIRKKRIRNKISGITDCPRLVVFRSNKHISSQIIDDLKGKTLAAFSDLNLKQSKKIGLVEKAALVGRELAKKAIAANINKVVFDRAGYKYHGAVKALADSAREGGLKF